MNEAEKKMIDVLYREGYSLNEIRAFRQHNDLRDDIAMRATEADIRVFQDIAGKKYYAKAKYAYADEMLKARVAD